MNKLNFQPVINNAKLKWMGKGGYTFSLLSGWTCPGASECLSKVININNKSIIVDGKNTKFRCFSATQEAAFPNVYKSRLYNFELLKHKSKDQIVELIKNSLPKDVKIIRNHVAGDYFNENYFLAWMEVAELFPNIIIYSYTKSLKYWVKHIKNIPKNFILTASRGGKDDYLIDKFKLKSAKVVFSEEEAKDKNLEIDHDDSHAFKNNNNFALLIHGTQPKKSIAAEALTKLRNNGIVGYGKKIDKDITNIL